MTIPSGGCYQYIPADPATVGTDEEVRVLVTPAAAVRAGPYVGVLNERMEGFLAPLGPDSLSLRVWIGRNYPGTPFANVRHDISLARQEVLEVRQRELSIVKSGAMTGLVLGALAILISRVTQQEDPNPGPPNGGGPPPTPDPVLFPAWGVQH